MMMVMLTGRNCIIMSNFVIFYSIFNDLCSGEFYYGSRSRYVELMTMSHLLRRQMTLLLQFISCNRVDHRVMRCLCQDRGCYNMYI